MDVLQAKDQPVRDALSPARTRADKLMPALIEREQGRPGRAADHAADRAVVRCRRALVSELSEEGADLEAAGAEQADWCRLLRFPKVLQVAA